MENVSVIRRGWQIVRGHRSLFGFSAASALASGLGFLALYAAAVAALLAAPGSLRFVFGLPPELFPRETLWPFSPWLFIVTALGLIAWPLLWLLGLAARAALIAGAAGADETGRIAAGQSFGRGLRRAPRLAAMAFLLFLPNLVFYAVYYAVAIGALRGFMTQLLAAPDMTALTRVSSFSLLSTSLSFLALVLNVFLQFIYAFAFRGVVLNDLQPVAAIRHGWAVLRANANDILPPAAIFGATLVGAAVLWYGAFFAIYVLFIIALLTNRSGPSLGLIGVAGIAFLGLLALSYVAAALYLAWRSAAFTVGYRRWTRAAAAAGEASTA